jgi:hypothetical protein
MTQAELEERMVKIELRVKALEAKPTAASGGDVADDQDLDGKYGDVELRYPLKEKYWTEPQDISPETPKRMSQCEPEYLDAVAKYLAACAYMARKGGDEKKAGYKDKDAARARGWAKRLRNGYAPKANGIADAQYEEAGDLPF